MLHEFLDTNREELIARCRVKAAMRIAPRPSPLELQFGIPIFLEQLIETFRAEQTPEALASRKASGSSRPTLALVPTQIAATATLHGGEMLRHEFTVDQVVHDYGDLCQALTELAMEMDVAISADEFHSFNRCLDDAIADAVTGFSRGRDDRLSESQRSAAEHRGVPTHEMLNLIDSAMLSFAAIKAGTAAVKGATSVLHETTLVALRNLVDTSLDDERPAAGAS